MYGENGAPKGYSTPRGVSRSGSAAMFCQKCGSSSHWSFACTAGASGEPEKNLGTRSTAKLSRTQLLRLNIKPKPKTFMPEPTEREVYDEKFKQAQRALVAEAKQDRDQLRQALFRAPWAAGGAPPQVRPRSEGSTPGVDDSETQAKRLRVAGGISSSDDDDDDVDSLQASAAPSSRVAGGEACAAVLAESGAIRSDDRCISPELDHVAIKRDVKEEAMEDV